MYGVYLYGSTTALCREAKMFTMCVHQGTNEFPTYEKYPAPSLISPEAVLRRHEVNTTSGALEVELAPLSQHA